MKIKTNTLFILLTFALIGCQKDIELEYQSTDLLIQYSDDVSPCRAFLTPEHLGEVQTWRINGHIFETAFVNDSCTKELILVPDSVIYLKYETIINNIVYTYEEWIESPPVANKLTIYSMNLINESFINQEVSLYLHYDYDFVFKTDYSSGSVSGGGGRSLSYNEASSLYDLHSPVEVPLTSAFGDMVTPHILEFDIVNYANSQETVSSSATELQDLYFNFRFNYDDDAINNPNVIIFKNIISSKDYELIVDWTHEEM
jgi:hypothetical protein